MRGRRIIPYLNTTNASGPPPAVTFSSTSGTALPNGAISFAAGRDVLLSSQPFLADVLMVGGGGGGGTSGGGGAGRVRRINNVLFGTQTPLFVGVGGAGATNNIRPTPGGHTCLMLNSGPLWATGGAVTGILNQAPLLCLSGSGGGMGSANSGGPYAGGSGEGFSGESAGGGVSLIASPFAGGGGGGASQAGGTVTVAGNGGKGGDGVVDNITGSPVTYGGGGGGTGFSNGGVGSTPGAGGAGGGGAGSNAAGINGTDGLGGGGGAAFAANTGGKGGDGVLIILPKNVTATVGNKIITPFAASISMSATNLLGFWSVVRLTGYAGKCLQMRRLSDNAVQDIDFVGNIVDWASIDAFLGKSAGDVSIWYDQSGAANNLLPTKSAGLATNPTCSALNSWFQMRPVSLDGQGNTLFQAFQCATVVGNTSGATIYQISAPRTSADFQGYWSLTDATFASRFANLYSNAGTNLRLGAVDTGIYPRCAPGTLSVSMSSTTGQIVRCNGQQFTTGNIVANAFGGIQVGISNNGSGNVYGIFDLYAMALYGAAHTSVQMQANEAILSGPFNLQTNFTTRAVINGDSLNTGYLATENQQWPWQLGFGKSAQTLPIIAAVEPIIMAVGGRTLATEYSVRTTLLGRFDVTKTNLFSTDAGTNDISIATVTSQADAEAQADALFNTVFVPYFLYVRDTVGYLPANCTYPTLIARGAFTTANFKEYFRLRYNANIIAGAATYGYKAADRASAGPVGAFSTPAGPIDTTRYGDQTHCVNIGQADYGGADRFAMMGV